MEGKKKCDERNINFFTCLIIYEKWDCDFSLVFYFYLFT